MVGLVQRAGPEPRSPLRRPAAALALVALALAVAGGTAAALEPTPRAGFTVALSAIPLTGEEPLRVDLSAVVSQGTPTAFDWTFGDGSELTGSNAADANPVHTYTVAGTHTVRVVVWEGTTNATAQLSIHVTPGPLAVTVSASPERGTAPLTVLFTANATGGSGTYVGFDWSFGDGGRGVGPVVANTYRSPGLYTVRVIVNDSAGATNSTNFAVDVGAAPGPAKPFLSPPVLWAASLLGGGAVVAAAVLLWWARRSREPERPTVGESPMGTEAVPPVPLVPQGDPVAPDESRAPEPRPIPALAEPVLPAPVPPAPARPSPDLAERRRLSRQIVLRMAEIGRFGPHETPDARWTQQGIGEALDAQQNRVSNVLRRLVAVGVVEVETRHVLGRPRRLKVYRLTPRGEALARGYRIEDGRRRADRPTGDSARGPGPAAP